MRTTRKAWGLVVVILFLLIIAALVYRYNLREEKELAPAELPAGDASQGASRAAQKVWLEIDYASNIDPPPASVISREGTNVTLEDIFGPAGIEIDVHKDESLSLGKKPISDLDIYDVISQHEQRLDLDNQEWKVYCLVAGSRKENPNEKGLLFLPDRHAFVIFASALSGRDAAAKKREYFRVLAHELTHCFNLHHSDAEAVQLSPPKKTLEANNNEYSVVWKLSGHSLQHFSDHPRPEFSLGPNVRPFGQIWRAHAANHSGGGDEIFQCIDGDGAGCAGTLNGAEASIEGLDLQVSLPNAALPGPIVGTLILTNNGPGSRQIKGNLSLGGGSVRVYVKKENNRRYQPLSPVFIGEHLGQEEIHIPAEANVVQDIDLSVDGSRWVFKDPGVYDVRVELYPFENATERLYADAKIGIEQPSGEEALASNALMNTPGMALLYALGGGDGLPEAKASLKEIIRKLPNTRQADVARWMFIRNDLSPGLDPMTFLERPPRPSEALMLLEQMKDASFISDTHRLKVLVLLQDQLSRANRTDQVGIAREKISELRSKMFTDGLEITSAVLKQIQEEKKALITRNSQ
jgi:hypothetical protein